MPLAMGATRNKSLSDDMIVENNHNKTPNPEMVKYKGNNERYQRKSSKVFHPMASENKRTPLRGEIWSVYIGDTL